MTEKAPILTDEQWQIIKANDDARSQAAISASRAQETALIANAEFLKTQIAPLSHRDSIAVHAMQGLLSGSNHSVSASDIGGFESRIAKQAYILADFMLKYMEPKT